MTDVQSGYAAINGAKLYYEVAGEGDPLVFVHAGIADHTMWDGQFAEFAKHYRVVRYDQRGYGSSEPVDGEYSFREDLAALLEFLKIKRTALVGCSMGGGMCMDFTLERPDQVRALVMVGSGPMGLELDVQESPKYKEIEQASNAKDWDRVNELETQIFFDGEGRTPDQMDARLRAQVLLMNGKVLAHELKGLGKRKPPMTPPAAQRLAELRLPVLIIYGDRDEDYVVKAAAYMEQHIAGARKVLMSNTAHLPNMERPAEFNQIVLDFLKKL